MDLKRVLVRTLSAATSIPFQGKYFLQMEQGKKEFSRAHNNFLGNASCTMLEKGKKIGVYNYGDRRIGFVIDPNKCEINHISLTDSNSNISSNGKLRATGDSLGSLDELSNQITSNLSSHNEVNANLNRNSIIGIFIADKAPISILDALFLRKQILTEHKVQLPILDYSERGNLFFLDENAVRQKIQSAIQAEDSNIISAYFKEIGITQHKRTPPRR